MAKSHSVIPNKLFYKALDGSYQEAILDALDGIKDAEEVYTKGVEQVSYLAEILIELRINNKYLSMLLNEEVTKRDLK